MAGSDQELSLPSAAAPANPMLVGAAILVAIGALYIGSGIFVPLVMAILLTFALAPVVRMFRRLPLPHVAAVLLAVLCAACIIGTIAYVIVTQLARLAGELPQYQQVVSDKIRSLQQTSVVGGDLFDRFAGAVQNFGSDVQKAGEGAEQVSGQKPMPVTIVNGQQNPFGMVQGFLGSLLGPLATAAIVTVFVVFLLLEREDFRDRFLKLVSRGDLRTSTKVMNEAAQRVSRYLLIQLSVNLSYGVVFGTGLFLIGIPNAILWGLIAALFRYIPFVGTLIAASVPFALAFAVDPGWGMLLKTVALFVSLELAVTNAIEPRLYGSSTGLSALAVIVAAMFWATLWGPLGLILSTPLTVCLVVIGRYVPQLRFFEIMLGSDPVLVREEQLYQRLLSGNIEEAVELAETHLATSSPQVFFDEVAIPALRLAEADRARAMTDMTSRRRLVDGMGEVMREIEHLPGLPKPSVVDDEAHKPLTVLCIGGRTELDGAVADMIAQVLNRPGITARSLPAAAVGQEGIGQIDLEGVDVICLAYLSENPRTYARFVARRIKRRAPDVEVIACLFNAADAAGVEDAAGFYRANAVATSIGAVEARVLEFQRDEKQSASDAGLSADGFDLEALQAAVSRKDRVAQLVGGIAGEFDAQLAMITAWQGSAETSGQVGGASDAAETSTSQAGVALLGAQIVSANAPVVVEDVTLDNTLAQNAFLLENNIRFFAGAPLRDRRGMAVGSLFVVGHDPRIMSEAGRLALQDKADLVMKQILLAHENAALAG